MDLKEEIIIELIATDEEKTIDEAADYWFKWKDEFVKRPEHFGDCIKQPQPCLRCVIENYYRRANRILALLRKNMPLVLSDEDLAKVQSRSFKVDDNTRSVAKAQRDADMKYWFGGLE
jgi:hypothetical protein